jgi:hypothetical protein
MLTAPRPFRCVMGIRAESALLGPGGPEGGPGRPAFMGRMLPPQRWPPWSSGGVSICCAAGLDSIA